MAAKDDVALHHLRSLEKVLAVDHLEEPNLSATMARLVTQACEALDARQAFIALWRPSGGWSACDRWQQWLDADQISEAASITVLECVRRSESPVLVTENVDVDMAGTPIECGTTWFASDRVQLTVDGR